MNILFLSSSSKSDKYPLCLQEYNNKTILEFFKQQSLKNLNANYRFMFLNEDIKRYHLDNIAKVLFPEATIVALPGITSGSACTALYGACTLRQDIPLLIISTNEVVNIDYATVLESFEKSNADGGVMTFNSVHPRYSYVKILDSYIVEFCQRNPVSNFATTGSFWFKKTSDFVNAAKKSIFNNCVTASQYYIAPVYNQMILECKKIHYYDVTGKYIPFKEDMKDPNYLENKVHVK